MKNNGDNTKRMIALFGAASLLVIALAVIVGLPHNLENKIMYATAELGSVEARFAVLSQAHTNLCAPPEAIEALGVDTLEGSCCSPMELDGYKEQLEGLKKYADNDLIPPDPYNVTFALAERLLAYDKTITLTEAQQAIYDKAMTLADDGGPCCCKCWRWYAFEGQAKYFITQENFTAEQIAEVWNLEDGCGD